MIELKISALMSEREGIENRLIRISEELRTHLGVSLGEFIVIKGVALQVDKIYKDDFLIDSTKAFVTISTFRSIGQVQNDFEIQKHVTLGCDPEFFLVNNVKGTLYNPAFLFKKQDSIGYDGMAVELRPQPSLDQEVVVQNLYTMIQSVRATLDKSNLHDLDMVARSSGWGVFTGFHVHMGIPKHLLSPHQKDFGKILKIILKALDYYVGTLSVLAEKSDSARRCSPFVNYGKVSDYRVNTRTLEYRVPGGALLKHPGLSSGLLGMCSLVVHDLIERLNIHTEGFTKDVGATEDTFLKEVYPNVIESAQMFNIICTPTTQKAEEEAPKILNDFKYMANYKQYKNAIDTFMHLSTITLSDSMWTNWQTNKG